MRMAQNWLGGSDWHPLEAEFVPPPHERVRPLLDDLAEYAPSSACWDCCPRRRSSRREPISGCSGDSFPSARAAVEELAEARILIRKQVERGTTGYLARDVFDLLIDPPAPPRGSRPTG